jgi:hypothetical protein
MWAKGGLTEQEKAAALAQKLADLHEDLGDETANFKASFALDLPRSPNVPQVDNNLLWEQEFMLVTHESIDTVQSLLDRLEIPYRRPPTMFAEMMKTEEQMQRIRDSLNERRQQKEQFLAKTKQKKAAKTAPRPPKQQKRPGVTMKPHKNPKAELRKRAKKSEK